MKFFFSFIWGVVINFFLGEYKSKILKVFLYKKIMSKKFVKKDDKEKKTRSGRNFLITQNNIEKSRDTIKYLKSLKNFRFIVGTREIAPETEHLHDHFFVQTKDSTKLSKTGVNNAHIDLCKGTVWDGISYIYKIKEPWKKGLVYCKEGDPTYFHGLKVKDAIKLSEEDKKELPIPLLKAVNYAQEYFKEPLKASETFKKDLKVYYFWGDSCSLKSKTALDLISKVKGNSYDALQYANGFWNGVTGKTKVALLEEYRESNIPPEELIKFIDYNKHMINVKHGERLNEYTTIILTSVQDPSLLYKEAINEETRFQWLRRLHVYRFWFDIELKDYWYIHQDYMNSIKERKCPLIPKFFGTVFYHPDGTRFSVAEMEKIPKEEKNKGELTFLRDMRDEAEAPVPEEERKLGDKEITIKMKREKFTLSEEELKQAVYKALTTPLEGLPATDEETKAILKERMAQYV